MLEKQKRVAAIHDISGFGKCSLTVALPILSSAGIETSVIPTATLSTHTGGIEGFTYRDLTEDMLLFAKHWSSLNINFDSIYTGFLGSHKQIDIVSNIIDILKNKNTLVMVDPCMADNGSLYKIYSKDMVSGMRTLCSKADIIVPNITEACFLLDQEYKEGPYSKQYIEKMLKDLSKFNCKQIVLTGVCFDNELLGAASYDIATNTINYAFNKRIPGSYHGTGDVFASALLSSLLNNISLSESIQVAVDFTYGSILRTREAKTDTRFGVNFEQEIPNLIKNLNI